MTTGNILSLLCAISVWHILAAAAAVNECALGTHTCHPTRAECINLPISYFCLCSTGYKGDGRTCTDIDECTSSTDGHNCHAKATCNNTLGSFACTCNNGYSGSGTTCTKSTNECALGTHTCHPTRAECIDLPISYFCLCSTGYKGDGRACTDIDECTSSTDGHNCHAKATCNNTLGSFACTCNNGYSGNGTTCTKSTNECALGTHTCHPTRAECVDLPISYFCLCSTGYKGDGRTCTDIDECTSSTDGHNCHAKATCNNTLGSFTCTCNNGYTGSGTTCTKSTNECALGTHTCHPTRAECINLPISYFCLCSTGYKGDGRTCTDIDECTSSTDGHNCHAKATCNNTLGSFACTCNSGYIGDGKQCSDRCEPKTISGQSFSETLVGKTAFSEAKCENGRPEASIVCAANNASGVSFDLSTLTSLGCEVTVTSILNQTAESSKEIENQTNELQLVTTGVQINSEQKQQIIDFLQTTSKKVDQHHTKVTVNTLSHAVSIVSNLPRKAPRRADPSEHREDWSILRSLQSLASNVVLGSNTSEVTLENENVTMQVSKPHKGKHRQFNDSFHKLNVNSPGKLQELVQAGNIILPSQVFEQADNQTNGKFQSVVSMYKLNNGTWVISAEVGKHVNITNLTRPVHITFTAVHTDGNPQPVAGKLEMRKEELSCQFLDPKTNTFSSKGMCRVNGTTVCQSTHLTSFAILVNHKTYPMDVSLSIVSIIGCSLSIIGLLATVAVHLSVKSVRSIQQTKVFLHLCVSLTVFYAVFVFGVWQTRHKMACNVIAAVLHYILLVCWCWMAVYSHCVYSSLTNLMGIASNYVFKTGIFAYGAPLLAVAMTIGLSTIAGGEKTESMRESPICRTENQSKSVEDLLLSVYRSSNKCWLQGSSQLYGFVIPSAVLLLFNCVMFALLMKQLLKRKVNRKGKLGKKLDIKQELIIAVIMATTMGFSWIFGYISLMTTDITFNTIMSWLFAISSSIQGLLIFVLTGARRPELRSVWLGPLRATVIRTFSRLSSSIRTNAGKAGKYNIRQKSSSTEHIATSSSIDDTLASSTTVTGDSDVAFKVSVQAIRIKGKSDDFGTVKITSKKDDFNYERFEN